MNVSVRCSGNRPHPPSWLTAGCGAPTHLSTDSVGPREMATSRGTCCQIPEMMGKSGVRNSPDYSASCCRWYSNSGLLTFRPEISAGTDQYFLSTCQGQGLLWVQGTSCEPNALPQSLFRRGHGGHLSHQHTLHLAWRGGSGLQ